MPSPADLISTRSKSVDASGIRKVFDLAAKLKDPINLSIGLPDFDVPEPAKLATIDAIRRGENRYTQTQGIAPLRERLRRDLSQEFKRDVGEVLITSGVSGGLYLAMLALLNPGDEVVFMDPYFVMYKHLINLTGGVPVTVDSYPDFKFRADRFEAALTPKTKFMILGSPGNPTGAVMSETEIRDAVALARKHDLLIVSDEIYEPFLYDVTASSSGERLYSAATLYEKTIVLRGFGKSHGMTGWRLAYAFGPAEIIAEMTKLQQYTYVCAPSALQHGALAALDVDMKPTIDAYRRKRDFVYEQLNGVFEMNKPGGAFYAFPKAPNGMTASEFVSRAIEKNVLVIPGSVFSSRDTHFRISYANTDEKLAQGCEILKSIAR